MSVRTMGPTSGQDAGLFFRRFLRNPFTVGSVCPSSRHLAAAMLEGIELGPGSLVVEYGPGTGVFTRAIQQRLAAAGGGRYLGIELDEAFCTSLRSFFPDFDFAQGSVEEVAAELARRSLPPPAAIVSGLPLIFMECMEQVIRDASRVLAPGGTFATFTYLQSSVMPAAFRVRAAMRAAFAEFERSPLVLRNVPPAFVLRGRKALTRSAAQSNGPVQAAPVG